MAIDNHRRDGAQMSGMWIVACRPGGPFATFTAVATVLAAILAGAAAAAIVLVLTSVFAAGAVLASALAYWWQRRSGPSAPDFASWSIDGRPLERTATIVGQQVAPAAAPYLPLNAYLEHRYASSVVLTFEQMESLLGFSLPPPACTEREWWIGEAGLTDGHDETWRAAGRTATPNLFARTVAFTRVP